MIGVSLPERRLVCMASLALGGFPACCISTWKGFFGGLLSNIDINCTDSKSSHHLFWSMLRLFVTYVGTYLNADTLFPFRAGLAGCWSIPRL
jgi:hypothetical protein